jgi:hypothetical protein
MLEPKKKMKNIFGQKKMKNIFEKKKDKKHF